MNIQNGNDPSGTRLIEAIAGSSGSVVDQSAISSILTGIVQNNPADGEADAGQTILPQLGQNDGVAPTTGDGALDAASIVSTLDVAGNGTTLQSIFDATNVLIKDFHAELETLSHGTGTNDIIHAVTNLGETIGLGEIGVPPAPDGPSNLLTDVLNLPGDLLSGNLDGIISNIGHDLSNVLHAVDGVEHALLFGNDAINPIPELIQSLGSDVTSLPLLSLDDGNGGLLNGVVGNLSHSSSNHLADVNVGPEQDSGGLVLDVLAAPESGPHHTVDANVIDVGPTGPHLAALDVLTGGEGLNIPGLGNTGADSLVGNVLNLGGIADLSHADNCGLPALSGLSQLTDTGGLDLGALVSADHGILNLHGVHLV